MTTDIPYFMENESWYYYDIEKKWYYLTDKAPAKAKESYKQFCKVFEFVYGVNKNV